MTCTSCQTPTAEGMHLCIDCVLKLEAILDAAPEMLKEARTTIERMDRISDKGAATRHSGTPPEVLNVECSDRADELEELLFSWARCLLDEADERGVTVGRYGTEYARLLREHTALVRMADWAGDCLAELRRAYRRLVQAVDSPPDVVDLGPCGVEGCDGRIRGQWEATARGRVIADRAQCRTCRAVYAGKEVFAFLTAGLGGQSAGLREAVEMVKSVTGAPSRRTLSRWLAAGWLRNVGTEAEPRVDLGELAMEIRRRGEEGREAA